MIEIKMDEAGYEVYYSLDEAVKAFTHNIALENATLDLDIGLLLESDVDPFSNYGMEAISDRVKEMASKAKSNFVLYAKKLINLLFGWFIKMIKGVVDVKKSMSSNYAKAKKYLEALNKYETQARQSSEKTMQITNSGDLVLNGLTFIQFSMIYMNQVGNTLKNAKGGTQDRRTLLSVITALSEPTTKLAVAIYGMASSDKGDENVSEIVNMLQTVDYDCRKLYEKYSTSEMRSKYISSIESKAGENVASKVSAGEKLKPGAQDDEATNISKSAESEAKNLITNFKKYWSNIESEEVKVPKAFDIMRNNLKSFINVSKANKWNFESYVKSVENARRVIMKELDNLKVNDSNDKDINAALSSVVNTGNLISKIQTNSGEVMSKINGAMSKLMTDVTKLGSILTTIGGGPAKDKDADE